MGLLRDQFLQSEKDCKAVQARAFEISGARDEAQRELSECLRECQSLKAKVHAKDSRLAETDKACEQANLKLESLQSDISDLKVSSDKQCNELEETLWRKADAD